jgi:hypothetical protein
MTTDTGPVDVIGELMPQDIGYAKPVQPGGIGTPVTAPIQTVDELTGDFYFGCGHSLRSIDVQIQGLAGCPTAFLRCPICKYLQRIISPASALYSDSNAILIA